MNLRRVTSTGGGYPFAVAMVVLATAVFVPFRGLLQTTAFMLLYVPVIITIARLIGVRASVAASVLAFLALDLLFIPPYLHLTVGSPAEWLGLLVFLIVATAAGQQTGQLRARERAAVRRQEELALLNRLAFHIASEKSVAQIAEFIVAQVTEVLGASRAAVYASEVGAPAPQCLAQAGESRPSSGETALVGWVLRAGKAVGIPHTDGVPFDQRLVSVSAAEAIPGVETQAAFLPLQTATSLEGVLFAEPASPTGFSADDARLLAAVANLAATSLERQRLEEEASHTAALREADRLKSTLVSSVSHELKTPLAAATARVTGLVEEGESVDAARVHDELAAVAEDLVRLNDSIGDLLDLSRLESDTWQPHFDAYEVREILGTVLARLSAGQRERVRFDLPEELPDITADFSQLARAISNLVENALVYSPADTAVTIAARPVGDSLVELSVADEGPGIPAAEKPRVFEKFYRGSTSGGVPSGTGLGLAITREIVRTHNGALGVEDVSPHGARFTMTIPTLGKEPR